MKTTKSALLSAVESVQPGVNARDHSEQGTASLAFRDGLVASYNEEVCCRSPTHLDPAFRAVVKNSRILQFLRKLSIEDVEINVTPHALTIQSKKNGRRTKTQLALDSDLELPIDSIPIPTEWSPLPHEFCEAVVAVEPFAGNDRDHPEMSCLRLAPDCVEAHDGYRAARYRIETGLRHACLVRRESIRQAAKLGACEYAFTENWIHLRNPSGCVTSCRLDCGEADFNSKEVGEVLAAEGILLALPGDLEESLKLAGLFSGDDPEDDTVRVRVGEGKFRVSGKGVCGRHGETFDCELSSAEMDFRVSPKNLVQVWKVGGDCTVTSNTIRCSSGPLTCCSVLMAESNDD